MSVWDSPGGFCDSPNPSSPQRFWDLGYRWIIQQAQNDTQIKPVDLSVWKEANFKTGVWGVTYDVKNFARDGAALAKRANDTVADLCVIDAEECLKNTDPAALIAALAAYPGPKALSTLGGASGQNIFPIDYEAFLDAGYDILPQAYVSLAPEYGFAECLAHMLRVAARDGLDPNMVLARTHLSFYSSPSDFTPPQRVYTGAEQAAMLQAAGYATPDVSAFIYEFQQFDYEAMGVITLQKAPPPPPTNGPTTRKAVLPLLDAQVARWKTAGVDPYKQAIGLADAVMRAPAKKQKEVRAALGI